MSGVLGAKGTVSLTVSHDDTSIAFKSGDVAVLATPRLIALCEEASVLALDGLLPVGQTTVGMKVQFDHLQPTGVGQTVVAVAVLDKVEGRRITFHVKASDNRGLVAAGYVTRVLVDTDRFMDKLL